MVLGPQGPGRVGRRRCSFINGSPARAAHWSLKGAASVHHQGDWATARSSVGGRGSETGYLEDPTRGSAILRAVLGPACDVCHRPEARLRRDTDRARPARWRALGHEWTMVSSESVPSGVELHALGPVCPLLGTGGAALGRLDVVARQRSCRGLLEEREGLRAGARSKERRGKARDHESEHMFRNYAGGRTEREFVLQTLGGAGETPRGGCNESCRAARSVRPRGALGSVATQARQPQTAPPVRPRRRPRAHAAQARLPAPRAQRSRTRRARRSPHRVSAPRRARPRG